jgi:hypothetical protein
MVFFLRPVPALPGESAAAAPVCAARCRSNPVLVLVVSAGASKSIVWTNLCVGLAIFVTD